jgi:thioredoxin reductase
MKEFLDKEVTDLSDNEFEEKFGTLDSTLKQQLLDEFTKIRLQKNNEFAIKDVFDQDTFEENAIVVKDRETGELKEIPAQGVFVYVGYQPYTDFVKGVVELDEHGYIITDAHMHTNIPGVFAAGDVRSGNLAQVAVAVGDGAKAAIAVREYQQAQN